MHDVRSLNVAAPPVDPPKQGSVPLMTGELAEPVREKVWPSHTIEKFVNVDVVELYVKEAEVGALVPVKSIT
jgi:NifB/MoaA-like Fe-S oxidoreductase